MNTEQIARVCHEVNRAYCEFLGDGSQLPWEEAPEWQRHSAIAGVEFTIDHPEATPADSHKSWLAQKQAEGWRWGPTKDAEKKEHPCYCDYGQLPRDQRAKDYLFQGVVRAMTGTVGA